MLAYIVLWHQYTYMSKKKKWDWNYAAELEMMIMSIYNMAFRKLR